MPKEAISSLYANRFHQGYARWKLRLDPVYHVVSETLKDTSAPVLDIGCGIGLLAHYLSATGVRLPFTGVDFDRSKIAAARETSLQLEHVTFSVMDLRDGWPAHQGSVTLLDILQYVGRPDREDVLKRAAQRTAGNGRLIIRTGIHDSSWRFRFTQLVDRLANVFWWMKSGPQDYPTKESITSIPIAEGLRLLHMHPLQGKLPFNNYVFIFVRDGDASLG